MKSTIIACAACITFVHLVFSAFPFIDEKILSDDVSIEFKITEGNDRVKTYQIISPIKIGSLRLCGLEPASGNPIQGFSVTH